MGFFCFCLGMLLMDDQRAYLHVCMHLGDGFRVQGMGLHQSSQFAQASNSCRREEKRRSSFLLCLV
jgi:hypothetical protein